MTIKIPEPVSAVHEVSLDTTCKKPIRGFKGKTISPIDHQRLYLYAAKKQFGHENDADTRWILKTWEEVLNDLEFNPERLISRLDWAAKKWLLQTYMDAEKVDWKDPSLIAIDLEYHNVNPDRGLFLAMEMAGNMERLSTENEIKEAITLAPRDTRAAIRGLCIERFHSQIESVQWERIVFKNGFFKKELDLKTLFEPEDVLSLKNRLSGLSDIAHFFL